ncbi:O-antigen ligase family protein [Spiribacter sp. 2438]|nr:O-antigen ligase family protein [Spiribacter sp. 2438]
MSRSTAGLAGSVREVPRGSLRYWALGCLYLFAFIPPQSIALGQLSQLAMLIVAVIIGFRHRHLMSGSVLLWIGVAYVLYVLGRGVIAAFLEQPELTIAHLDGTSSWARTIVLPTIIFGLVLLATGNWARHATGAIVALVLGVLAFEVLPAWSWNELTAALQGSSRYIFGMGHSRSGFLIGAALILALGFAPALVSGLSNNGSATRSGAKYLRFFLWVMIITVLLIALFATKTRTAWFAVLPATFVVVLAAAWIYRDRLFKPQALIGMLALVMLVAGVIVAGWGELERRLTSAGEGMQQTLQMQSLADAWELEDRNVGARVAYKVFAIQLWVDRPLAGWGPAEPYYLMDKRPIPPLLEGRSGHFHDAHVEILARLGLTGWLLIMAFVACLMFEAFRMIAGNGRNKALSSMLALTGIGFAVLMLVWMLGTHQITRFQSSHVIAVFLGPICASHFQRLVQASE